MKSLSKIGLVLTLFCGSFLALSSGSLRAQGVGHGGTHGGLSGIHNGNGCGNFFGGSGFGFGFGLGCGGLYGCDLNFDDHIPFYALHPPVYYSRIVPRAYGWTPFAYEPDAVILPLEDSGPKEIINPYVPPSNTPAPQPGTKAKPSSEHTADDSSATPHLIINPFVATSLASEEK